MTSLRAAERLEIEQACERQIRRFAFFNDTQQHQNLVDLFTEDGAFARPTEPDTVIQGRAAILDFFVSRPARLTRHLMCNTVVEVQSAEEARAYSTVVLYIGDDSTSPAKLAATLIGGFADTLRRVDEEWLFAARHGSLAIRGDGSGT
ncbi:MAG: nuclear transport factor 2 family protein [Brevundimonas sp.]